MYHSDEGDMAQKFQIFLQIAEDAIHILKKYIAIFANDPEKQALVSDLKHGLEILEKGTQRRKDEGIAKFAEHLKKYPRDKRPGLGLSRGFSEFLYTLPDEPWIDEIMNAVRKIERYYASL